MSKKVQTLLKELEEIERKLKKQGTYIPDFTAYEGTTLQRDKSTGNTKCQKKKLKNNQEQISKIFKRKQIEFSNRKNIIAFSQLILFLIF